MHGDMNDDFWDFAIGYGGHRADGFSDLVCLMRLGKAARPPEVVTQKDLQLVLEKEGVELSPERRQNIWKAYLYWQSRQHVRSSKE